MTPAQLALSMAALGGARVVVPAATSIVAPAPAANPPASTAAPAPASLGLSGSILAATMQAPLQIGATPWGDIIAELGFGRAGSPAAAAQPDAAIEPDMHGWNAIVEALNAHPPSRSDPGPSGSVRSASTPEGGATDWATIIAEAGLGRGATHPGTTSGADPEWAQLAAEVAAERHTTHQD